MIRSVLVGLTISLLVLSGFARGVSGKHGETRSPFSIMDRRDDGLLVRYTPRPRLSGSARVDSTEHIDFAGPAFSQKAGDPNLPADVLSVGIPADARVEADLQDPVYITEHTLPVAPVPSYLTSANGAALPEYIKNPSVYSRDEFYPSRNIRVGSPSQLHGQTIVSVHIASVQYNPVTRVLRRLVGANVRVRFFRPAGARPLVAPPSHDPFELIFKSLLANYDQARLWRSPPQRGSRVRAGDTTRDWFTPGRTYVRIPIATDGWYRLGKDDLLAAGVSPTVVDWSSLNLSSHGNGIPFVLRADSSLEFYAYRNYGDSTYFDFYTDTNTVWLTWGGSPGQSYQSVVQPSGVPASTVRSSVVVKHFEQNTGFYIGTGDIEIGQNAAVPGRGWYWEFYYPQTSVAHAITLDSIDRTSYPMASITVRLYSTTTAYAADGHDHKVKLWVNDSLAGQVYFAGRTGVTWTASIPALWLNDGANVVTIKSDSSSTSTNQFYLDWFEVRYGRLLFAQGDQLQFAVTPTSPGLTSVVVSGFSSPLIEVFDQAGQRVITGGSVAGDTVQGYSLTFNDTLTGPRTYTAIAHPGNISVLPPSRKVFTDIRTNAQGADYIVITHKAFLAQAQQLAGHRATFNSVRTVVIDVQDIYDEFNFGVMKAEPVRDFLWYAYLNWPGNKPSAVLMFGGASWDFHHYLPTTVKNNYVPGYGIPSGDNWFVCFNSSMDSSSIPAMNIGRLPVADPGQAQDVVAKVIAYDTAPLGDWNKKFLFITDGDTPSEQSSFDFLSDHSIQKYINPPPFGGTVFRAYKSGPAVIDGTYRQFMKDLVKDGLLFINFLGHSGGAIWGVDIGPPNELENTFSNLPFVSSVSCNVGAFAEPSRNVLAELFVLAQSRGAVATWASSALGYPYDGSQLVDFFLDAATADSIRDFGTLTTLARTKLWEQNQDAISKSYLNLTPLLGDPMSRLIIPLEPDLAVSPTDISLNNAAPTSRDTSLTIQVNVHNYGLVPSDSITLQLSDLYNGRPSVISANTRIGPTLHLDTVLVPWNAADLPGRHIVTVNIDPAGAIPERDRTNNIASTDIYVYANALLALKPLRNQTVPQGAQTLVVSAPLGSDSAFYQYYFDLDTVPSFDSQFKVSSPAIVAGDVLGQWTTPALPGNRVFYWRARTIQGSNFGRWVNSSFVTSANPPQLPIVRIREYDRKQFGQEELVQATGTDTGVAIAPRAPLFLYARSVAYRYNQTKEYYSVLRLNDIVATGYWWHLGGGFMVMRVNEFTGAFVFQAFDVPSDASQSDSLRNFILNTPTGNYLAFSVIFDGATNVSDSLKATMGSLGSTMFSSVTPGQSWALIARKGYPSTALEGLTNDTVIVSVQIPDFFSYGIGWITSGTLPMPDLWHSLHWSTTQIAGKTDARLSVIGIRRSGLIDTLRSIPKDSVDVDMSGLGVLTSTGLYASFRIAVSLTTNDALVSPLLKEWWIDIEPPGDLAVSRQTVGLPYFSATKGTTANLPVTVYNIGYRRFDSTSVVVQCYDRHNILQPLASAMFANLAPGNSQSTFIPISTSYLSGFVPLHVTVSARKGNELSFDNNLVDLRLTVLGDQSSSIQLFSDGVQLMDGDYVSSNPTILVRLPAQSGTSPAPPQVMLYVDNTLSGSALGSSSGLQRKMFSPQGDPIFTPSLADGRHDLSVHISQLNLQGGIDSLERHLAVTVMSETHLLQVLNYPNPFSQETSFTFILTGSRPPDQLTIRVYTVAGRKIRELTIPQSALQIGFNRIPWNGKDNDGDDIANGYYLYQMQVRTGVKTDAVIGKLVKMR